MTVWIPPHIQFLCLLKGEIIEICRLLVNKNGKTVCIAFRWRDKRNISKPGAKEHLSTEATLQTWMAFFYILVTVMVSNISTLHTQVIRNIVIRKASQFVSGFSGQKLIVYKKQLYSLFTIALCVI